MLAYLQLLYKWAKMIRGLRSVLALVMNRLILRIASAAVMLEPRMRKGLGGSEMDTKFFERLEGKLAYDDSGGDGDLVIMEPGMGALRSEYRYLAPVLIEAGYRVVTVDLRGQGESSVGWSEYTVAASAVISWP